MNNKYPARADLGPTLLVLAWLCAGIAIAVVSLRYYVRIRIIEKIHRDDWIILLTLVSPPPRVITTIRY